MHYEKLGTVIRHSTPQDKKPRLTPEQIDKLKTTGEIILATIYLTGLVTAAAIAPNAVGAIGKLFLKKYPNRVWTKREKDRKLVQAFYYLKRSGQIRMRATGKDFKIYLTKLGKRKLKNLNINTLSIPKEKAWDKKWWQVAADIPTEEYKYAADLFRTKLKEMGFFPLQRTLWFYPFDPRKEIEFIIDHFGIERFVTVMEINRLDKDDERKMISFFKSNGVFLK